MDINTMTDDRLKQLRVSVSVECERRQRLRVAPGQMRDLIDRYEQDGGDPAVLADVIIGSDQVAEVGPSES